MPSPPTIERQIGDDLQRLREAYVALRERVEAGVDSVRRARQLLPFLRLPDMPTDVLQGLDQRMQELDVSLQELRATLDARDGPHRRDRESAGEPATGSSTSASARSRRWSGRFSHDWQRSVSRCKKLEATAQGWVTMATVVLTVMLVYAALLHLSLFAHGRAWMRTPREPVQTPT